MKAFLASGFCLLIGLAGGFFLGYRYHEGHITNEAVQEMGLSLESSDRLAAARGVRAIEVIQSGDTQRAIQMFSVPVADFYSGYTRLTHNDEKTKKLLLWIEQVASTNVAVAKAIHDRNE